MLSILFILFIIFILWPLIKIGWRIFMQIRSVRRFMADPAAEMRRRAGFRSSAPQPESPKKKKKKISRDVGEYVEFTEVETASSRTTTTADGTQSTTTSYTREEQVTDVKWEDLP